MAADILGFKAGPPGNDQGRTAGERDEQFAECRRLMALSLEEGFRQPAQAAVLARGALVTVQRLVAEHGATPDLVDLEAMAWGVVGNAERVGADLEAAGQAMRRADELRAKGSGDLGLAARLLDLRSSLEAFSAGFAEAHRLNDEAIALYLRVGDRAGLGRALVKRGVFLAHAEETERAVEVLQQAFEHLEPRRDRRSVLAATQCLAYCLHRMGYDIPAAQLVDQALEVVRKDGDGYLLLRLRWLKVRVQMNLGQDGEKTLRSLKEEFLEIGMIYDAALVCLDLATFYAKQRRLPDLQRLGREMFPIFTSRKLNRNALASLLLLRESLSSGRAELPFLAELRRFFERSRHDHALRFQHARSPR